MRRLAEPPAFTPAGYGLFSVAEPAVDVDDTHWRNGVEWQARYCGEALNTVAVCVTGGGVQKEALPNGLPVRGADPFAVYAWLDCSPVGYTPQQWRDLTVAALVNNEQAAVERALWTGTLTGGTLYPHLAADTVVTETGLGPVVTLQTAASVIVTGAVDVVEAVGLLEGAMAGCYGGVPVLHVPRSALAHLAAHTLVSREGPMLRTLAGSKVAAGLGYPGTAPDGTTPPAGDVWFYATGAVKVWRSEVEVTGRVPAEYVGRAGNDQVLVAERTYVAGWDCCVAQGSMVHTANRGPVEIETVVPGDEVWSFDEAGKMVRAVVNATLPKGEQDVLTLRTGSRSLTITPDHRVLVFQRGPRRMSPWEPRWVEAKDVAEGHLLVALGSTPDAEHQDRYLSDGTLLDPDVAWLLGIHVADGTVVKNGVQICVYGDTADRVVEIVERVWDARCSRDKKHGVVIGSKGLRQALIDLNLNARSTERRVPSLVRGASHKVVRAFLDGYGKGDGNWDPKRNLMRYACANLALLGDVRALHLAIGDGASHLRTEQRRALPVINGQKVKSALPLHWLRAYPNGRIRKQGQWTRYPRAADSLNDEHWTLERVQAITSAARTTVYDLSVEGTQNFTADGLVVHNCHFAVPVRLGGVAIGAVGSPA